MLRDLCICNLQEVMGTIISNHGSQVTVCRTIPKMRSKWELLDHERLKLNLCPSVQVPGQLRTLQPNVYSQLRWKFHNILSPLPGLMKTRNPINRKWAKTNKRTSFHSYHDSETLQHTMSPHHYKCNRVQRCQK